MSIVKIDTTAVSSVGTKKIGRKKTTSHGFSVEDHGESNSPGAIQVALSPQGLDALFLSLNDGHLAPDQKAIHQGEDLLKQLDSVRLGLVAGAIPKETLHRLKELENTISLDGVNEKLRSIMVEIQTRVHVELAKLEQ
jgi:hypothetical protein